MTFPHTNNKDKPSLLQGEHIPKRQTFEKAHTAGSLYR